MAGIRGGQIATGTLGVATANLVPGVLSADAAGRALFAAGVLDETTFSSAVANLGIVAGKLKLSGQTYDLSTTTAVRVPTPGVNPNDAATKQYVDSAVAGTQWKHSAVVRDYIGNVDVLGLVGHQTALVIEGVTPAAGDAYAVTVANGVGALATAAVGDIWQYVTATWTKIVSGSGGNTPVGTYVLLSTTTTLVAPFTDGGPGVGDDGKLVGYTGAGLAYALTTQADGMAVVVDGPGGSYVGSTREWSGTAWAQIITPSGGFVPANTYLMIAAPAASFILLAPLTDGVDEGKVVTFAGTNNDPTHVSNTIYTSIDGEARLIHSGGVTASIFEGQAYSFDGVVPTGDWNLVAAAVPFGTGIVSVGTANAPGVNDLAARDDHVHAAPKPYTGDKSQAPLVTAGNYATTGITITNTPGIDGHVRVEVNGISYPVGDGNRDDLGDFTGNVCCYFSVDAGASARAQSAITAGDTLYWNTAIAGFALAVTDEVNISYESF